MDLVSATLDRFKKFLNDRSNYAALLEDESQRKNAQMFLGDLPGDIKTQMKSWLKTNKRKELEIPEENK